MPLLLTLIEPVVVEPFPAQNQTAETLLYVLAFGLLMPAATFVALRVEAGVRDRAAFERLAAALLGSLAVAVLLIRLATEAGAGRLVSTALAGLGWLVLVLLVMRRGRLPALQPAKAWTVALALVLLSLATVVTWQPVSVTALIVALVAGLVLVRPLTSQAGGLPLPRAARIGVDLLVVALVALAVPDTMIVYPEAAASKGLAAFDTDVIQFHQNLFLGAAAQVLEGQAMLAGTVSQYGVASIYLIAGFFKLVPAGHGTLGLLDGTLTGLSFAAGYVTLRFAGVGRGVSALTLLVAVICLAWGARYPEGALLQHGAIRFALPLVLIPLAVAGQRWPRHGTWLKGASLAVLGLSSIWALEAFLYVAVTWAAIVLLAVRLADRQQRLQLLARECGLAVAAILAFHLAFALVTLAAAGSWPDWGGYLTYLREFLGGDIGDLTYDVVPFSPGLALAFAYLASAAGVIALAWRGDLRRRPAALFALAGLTAYGVILFSYFDNRSIGHVLPYVSLPAVLLGGLWMGLALERGSGFGVYARRALAVCATAGAAVMIGVAWPTAGERAGDSALAVVLPGGDSLRERYQRLKDLPPLVPGAAEGERLIDRHIPGEDAVPVITEADLDVNILIRAGRANALGITDAKEASWVPGPHLPVVSEHVARLDPGQRILLDAEALRAWKMIERDPGVDDLDVVAATGMQFIQVHALKELGARFGLREVARGEEGLRVAELVPR